MMACKNSSKTVKNRVFMYIRYSCVDLMGVTRSKNSCFSLDNFRQNLKSLSLFLNLDVAISSDTKFTSMINSV